MTNEDLIEEMLKKMRGESAFSDFMSGDPGDIKFPKFPTGYKNMGKSAAAEESFAAWESASQTWNKEPSAPPPVDWKAATFKGFVGTVAAAGWKLSLKRTRYGVNYSWRSPSGQQLAGAVPWTFSFAEDRQTSMDTMLKVCAKLAGWEPRWMYWRAAFNELGVAA